MNITPHVLLGSGRLNFYIDKITEEFDLTIKKVTAKISISGVDIVIYDNPRGVIPETGVGGYSPNEHLVFISLNPDFSTFENTISNELKRTLAHEILHVLRWKSPGYGKTLLEAIISEGLADHFDLEINQESPEPWSTVLNEKQIIGLLSKAKKEFDNKNYDHNAWFFGSKDGSIPKWTGYALGYKLVNDYLLKNNKKPSMVYSLRAEEFIK